MKVQYQKFPFLPSSSRSAEVYLTRILVNNFCQNQTPAKKNGKTWPKRVDFSFHDFHSGWSILLLSVVPKGVISYLVFFSKGSITYTQVPHKL